MTVGQIGLALYEEAVPVGDTAWPDRLEIIAGVTAEAQGDLQARAPR
jgi:hypothetical protein